MTQVILQKWKLMYEQSTCICPMMWKILSFRKMVICFYCHIFFFKMTKVSLKLEFKFYINPLKLVVYDFFHLVIQWRECGENVESRPIALLKCVDQMWTIRQEINLNCLRFTCHGAKEFNLSCSLGNFIYLQEIITWDTVLNSWLGFSYYYLEF